MRGAISAAMTSKRKHFGEAAPTERQGKLLVAPDVANAQYGLLGSGAFPIHAAFDDVFLAIGRRNMRWISIEIGSPNAILRPLLVDPFPQQVRCDPSFSTRRALGAHDIGCKS